MSNKFTYYSFIINWRSRLGLVCTTIPHLCFRWNCKRRLGVDGHALVSGCPEHWTIQP